MRVVSLVPAATEMVFALGRGGDLVGVTSGCSFPREARAKPVVVESALPPGLGSAAIDAAVQGAAREGRSLFRVHADALRALEPDLLLTQGLCEVCAASGPDLEAVLAALPRRPRVLTLSPTTLEGMLRDILAVGEALGAQAEAQALVASLHARIARVEQAVRGRARPRVGCLEWLDPPMQGGHWVPDLVARAGGEDVLGRVGAHAEHLTWSRIAEAAPEVLVLMPCGFDLGRALREGPAVLRRPELAKAPAVRLGRTVAMDGDAHFSRPGPRLVEGLEVLASILHPGRVRERLPWAWAPVQLAREA